MMSEQHRQHGWLLGGGLGALVMALAVACAPAPAPTPPTKAATPPVAKAPIETPKPKAAETPQRGGILVFAQRPTLRSPHPWIGDVATTRILNGAYEPLVRLDHRAGVDFQKDFAIKPALAEKWEQPNPTTYVFSLRKDVKWHDGQPFTADDVVFSMNTWRDPKLAPHVAGIVGRDIVAAEKVDATTVKMTTKVANADFLGMMALPSNNAVILAKHVADRGGDFAKVFIGTGPLKVKTVEPQSVAVLERNPAYWQAGKPYLDGAKVFIGVEQAALQAGFIAKEFDLFNVGDKAQFEPIQKAVSDVAYATFPSEYNNSLYPRQDRPPFKDVSVRQAMHLALDRQALKKSLTFDLGIINPPATAGLKGWGYTEEELVKLPGYRQPKDQDQAQAKRLLAEAGYPQGLKTTIRYARDRASSPPIAEAVAPMLKAVGIDATLEPQDRAVFLKAEEEGSYEIMLSLVGNVLPTSNLQRYFHSKGLLNKAGINDPKLDELIEKQAGVTDVAERKKLFRQIHDIFLEKMYAVPTIDYATFSLWHPYLKDYPLCYCIQAYVPQWENIWMDPAKAPKRSL